MLARRSKVVTSAQPAAEAAVCFALGDGRWVLQLKRPPRSEVVSKRVAFHFCLDNSGSMGQNTSRARTCFSKLLDLATEPSSLTVFANEASTLGDSLTTPAQMCALSLPRQGQTNISGGLETTVRTLLARDKMHGSVHNVVVLLSDGHHNVGPTVESTLPKLAQLVGEAGRAVELSVVVIGVSAASNTRLGMLAKAQLETVAIDALKPIYFCSSAGEMEAVLAELSDALRTTIGAGSAVRLACDDARFVTDIGAAPRHEADVFIERDAVLLLEGDMPRTLTVDGVPVPVRVGEWDSERAVHAVLALVDRARMHKVAGQAGVAQELSALDALVAMIEQQQRSVQESADDASSSLARLTPAERLKLFKRLRGAAVSVATARNAIRDVEAYRSDDSSAQAAFLNGAQSKYAAKALRRATDRSFDDVLADTRKRGAQMRAALRLDLEQQLRRAIDSGKADALLEAAALDGANHARDTGSSETAGAEQARELMRAVIGAVGRGMCETAELVGFVDGVLPAVLTQVAGGDESYLSLLSQHQHLLEWADAAHVDAATEYELLMSLGMMAHPIGVVRGAATQMDPYAMRVQHVLASRVDSPSLACAMQCETEVLSPEGPAIEDVLLLIDPSWPNASKLVYWSALADTLVSTTLCRDLYMGQGAAQRVALHAHALYSVVGESEGGLSDSAVRIALRIIYSMRQHWGAAMHDGSSSTSVGQIKQMLRQMLNLEPLTEAENDGMVSVKHPVQLLLGMCTLDMTELPALTAPALLILCNEALSRSARRHLRGQTQSNDNQLSMQAAHATLRTMLSIDDESVPYPTPVDETEPSREAVREAVSWVYELSKQEDAIRPSKFVAGTVQPILRCVHFANSLQAYAKQAGGWECVMSELEANDEPLVAHLSECMLAVPTAAAMLEYEPGRELQVATAMTAQALLHHTSAQRGIHIVASDVRSAETLHGLVLDVRMAVYDERLREKLRQWAAIASDVTYMQARQMGVDEFVAMIGHHAHGLSKAQFWAVAKAAREEEARVEPFLLKCNSGFRNFWAGDKCSRKLGVGCKKPS